MGLGSMVSDGIGRFRIFSGRFRIVFGQFQTVSDACRRFRMVFGRFRMVFGPFGIVFGPFWDRFGTASDRFGRLWYVFEPFSADSTQNFKISNFNWPGLGPVRAVPSVRAIPPQPWPIEICNLSEKSKKTSANVGLDSSFM